MHCISCEEETKKYKCTKCSAFYCSVNCYKIHKESIVCQQQQQALDKNASAAGNDDRTGGTEGFFHDNEPTIYEPFSTDDTVPRENLALLRHSKLLENLLYNPHLRNLLREIDAAPRAWRSMNAAMQEPLFVEFADECLKVVEPMTEAEHKDAMLN